MEKEFYERLEQKGVSRRDFLRYCTILTATLGLSSSFVPKVAEVFAAPKQRPPVIWLSFGECTGCTEALLRSMYPWVADLVLDILDIEYHETIMAAAGHQAEENLKNAVKKYKGKFICIVDGSIATKYEGAYGKIADRPFLEIAREVCPQALAVVAMGTCSSFGGHPGRQAKPRRLQIGQGGPGYKDGQCLGLSSKSDQSGGDRSELSPFGKTPGLGRPGASPLCLRQHDS